MAVLSTKQRKHMPKSEFAGPDRSFPIPDASHARAALSRASEALNMGHISKATYDHIHAMADAKLGDKPKGKGH